MSISRRGLWVVGAILMVASVGYSSWIETFDGGSLDLATWEFLCYPQLTGTFTQTILSGSEGNDYMAFQEVTSAGTGGAAFGAAFGSAEVFGDVRVGAVVNVAGDASHNHHGLLARAAYLIDDGSISGYPGVIASCYVMHVNWENGPANLTIDIEKVVTLQNIMDTDDFDIIVPGLDNAQSFYAELDVVGAGPVYVTGSLYEYQGGPLVARTPTLIDTAGNDYWEDPDEQDAPFTTGPAGIFAQNERPEPAGFYTTFDDVSAVSDGPSAAAVYPADGATDVSVMPTLAWKEAAFATGRQLWFGEPGQLQMIEEAVEGTTYTMDLLESGHTYQWRVDQVGAGGTVVGHTREFTTGDILPVEDFESYAGNADIASTWVHNIEGFDYVFLDTGTVNQGAKAMRLEYQNQYEPYMTAATRTFATPQDWTTIDPTALTLTFRGKRDNVEQRLYVSVEDAAGNEKTVAHPHNFAVQSEPWRTWEIELSEFTDAGVDLAAVQKLTIGLGDGTTSSQEIDDVDAIYLDRIGLK